MLSEERIDKVLKSALDKGGEFAELFFEKKESNQLSMESSRLEKVKTGFDLGVGIRVINGDQVSYAYTDDITLDSLLKTAKAAGTASKYNEDVTINNLQQKNTDSVHQIEVRPETVEKLKKKEVLKTADKSARSVDQRIQQVMVSYIDYYQQVLIANSTGLLVEDERVRTRLMVNAIASDGKIIQTGRETPGKHVGFELFDEYSPEEVGKKAGQKAITMLEARPAPSARMPVVVNHGFGGVLFHEACGHGLEADAVQKGSSVYTGRIGEQVANEKVTAIDDATVLNEWGSFVVDDEGHEAEETVLIKDGELTDYMYDYKTAKKEDRESTGNGRRQSYQSRPIPRMTNTFIAPGESKPQEIINSVDQGLYAKSLSGGQVEPATGDFTFTVAEGYLIEDGEVSEPVRNATLVGNGPESLHRITMVGDDLEHAPGMCGKEGQSIPAAVGQPTLLIEELTVGGTEREEE
ncbi:TldD/PmbA family protein [Acetohalobium arabaticum]|uniref:Peptidase U62 modulator of DNA gyrase n=1 Tax=Acetohalobium arabaticum (strain ATCC 49924 / DSM 5501 / Z-7288) TaxID=574087 RepID=D9QU95_ACEAZ|nr:TldD/PmbA family protein [Acetohalobium arabaticum]ADL11888.1 peptidase U62 modulator of DNA gyrase [Acetohalobium arabaticum DSM 5501]